MLPKRKIGQLLVERGLVSKQQLEEGLDRQKTGSGRIGSTLVKMGVIEEDDLLRFLSLFYDVPHIDLRRTEVCPVATRLLEPTTARRLMTLPVRYEERPPDLPVLTVATPDPTDMEAIDAVRQATGCQVEPYVCSYGMFEAYYHETYRQAADPEPVAPLLRGVDQDRLVRALVKLMVEKEVITLDELKCLIASTRN